MIQIIAQVSDRHFKSANFNVHFLTFSNSCRDDISRNSLNCPLVIIFQPREKIERKGSMEGRLCLSLDFPALDVFLPSVSSLPSWCPSSFSPRALALVDVPPLLS